MKVFQGTSGHLYEEVEEITQGSQGIIYRVKTKTDNNLYVVKWYKPFAASADQKMRLETLIERGAPVIALDSIAFIWPLEMVSQQGSALFGYTMPWVDPSQYVLLNEVILQEIKQPDPRSLTRLSYLVCVALDTLHAAGWAYCDLNTDNIAFDSHNVRISIWDNDNVVVNNTDVEVEGTLEFMAPEVRFGQSKPNAEADLYSVAVLLYKMWMWEHPMDGKRTFDINPWDDPAIDEYYLRKPGFAFHPSDMSNSARGVDILDLSVQRWDKLCPPVLKEAFTQSFTLGVHEPGERIRLGDWKRLFLSLEANAYPCPGCGAVNLVDGSLSRLECFNCGAVLPLSLVLNNRQQGREAQLVVHKGALLRGHHLGSADSVTEADKVIGEVEDHPNTRGAHILRNHTEREWTYSTPSGQVTIKPGKARLLVPDSQISIGNNTLFIERLEEPSLAI